MSISETTSTATAAMLRGHRRAKGDSSPPQHALKSWYLRSAAPPCAMTRKPHIQLEALHGLARALAAGEFRARTVLQRACAVVADGFGFERVGIVRYVPASGVLIPFAAHGLTAGELELLPAAVPIGR